MANILIVEDDATSQLVLKVRLTQKGHRVQAASSASEALKCLRAEPKPDLMFVDIHMPGKNGFELVEEVQTERADGQTPPVVFMSADARTEVTKRASALGAVGFLRKPWKPEELQAQIDAALQNAVERRPRSMQNYC